jgi:hypothetical protein
MRTIDADVIEAAGCFAATLETAARGVIYEHSPQSPPAQSLLSTLRTALTQLREQGATVYDREAAIALRAIENGAKQITSPAANASYLELLSRLLQLSPGPSESTGPATSPSGLILP